MAEAVEDMVDCSEGIAGALKFKSKLKQVAKRSREKKLANDGLGLSQKEEEGDPRGFVCQVLAFCLLAC